MSVKTYTVLKPMLHDKLLRRAGQTVELSDSQGDELIALGAVKLGAPDAAASASPVTGNALAAETLGKLNVTELTAYALAHGITPAEGATKADIITALTAGA